MYTYVCYMLYIDMIYTYIDKHTHYTYLQHIHGIPSVLYEITLEPPQESKRASFVVCRSRSKKTPGHGAMELGDIAVSLKRWVTVYIYIYLIIVVLRYINKWIIKVKNHHQ